MGNKVSHKHIVVVEDDAAMQELIKEFLERQGYETTVYRSAVRALEAVNASAQGGLPRIDLVISDINMPQMDGFEFLKLARQVIPDVPVILITAFGNRVTEKAALEEGAVAYLNKPFGLGQLKQLVAAHTKVPA